MPEIKVTIPYTTVLSKNLSHYNIAINKRVPTKAYTVTLKVIGMLIRGEMNKRAVAFQKGKVWLDIMIYRPDMRADPPNFIDSICDGVKSALGIDDRFYAGSWDWELDKKNPRIEIEVRQ